MAQVAVEPQNLREAEGDAPAGVTVAKEVEEMAPRAQPHVSRGHENE